jgi:inorganic pyrophosphatase
MRDEAGIDNTIVCVPCDDPGWNTLEQVDDLPQQLRDEIEHFFSIYKDLDPDRHSTVNGWADRDAALRELEQARARCHGRGRARLRAAVATGRFTARARGSRVVGTVELPATEP